jgi:hypothetical protein
MQFSLRVSFFFSGVNPAGLSPADASRILLLELIMHENKLEVAREIAEEVAFFYKLGPQWCGYMAEHALLIPAARLTFEVAFPAMDSRLRTNIATLLAGAFVSLHKRAPSAEEAESWARDFDETTNLHSESVERDDAFEAVHHLFAHPIEGVPLGKWLAHAAEIARSGGRPIATADVHRIIASNDILVRVDGREPGVFLLKGSPAIGRIFENTKWGAGGWEFAIKKLASAFSPRDPLHFPTIRQKARAIGLSLDLLPEADSSDPKY